MLSNVRRSLRKYRIIYYPDEINCSARQRNSLLRGMGTAKRKKKGELITPDIRIHGTLTNSTTLYKGLFNTGSKLITEFARESKRKWYV